MHPRRVRLMLIIGVVVMLGAVLDPLEGSLVILPAMLLVALAAHLGRSSHRALIYAGFVLAAAGIGAMWGLSAVGGFGGDTGRTNLWWFALLPYPVGWLMALAGGVKTWRDGFPPQARLSTAPPSRG